MFPTQFLCLIVDGMDQNTTMVPKIRQLVKSIESRYVKTLMWRIGTRRGLVY